MNKFKTELPYKFADLEPHLSEEQVRLHYEGHYMGYCKNLEKLIADTKYESMNLTQIVHHSKPPECDRTTSPIYNNAGQIKNHEFFFTHLTPNQPDMPDQLKRYIEESFGSVNEFKKVFKYKVSSFFGAGWAWLALIHHKQWKSPKLEIVTTRDGDTITFNGSTDFVYKGPVLVIDLWEHAYYIDFRNKRANYFDSIYNVIDWEKVNSNLTHHLSANFDYTTSFEL